MKEGDYLRECASGLHILLWVQPGARRSEIAGRYGDRLKVKVAAPPEKGRANEELVRFLASLLGCPAQSIELVAGAGGRAKTILVRLPFEEVRKKLEKLP